MKVKIDICTPKRKFWLSNSDQVIPILFFILTICNSCIPIVGNNSSQHSALNFKPVREGGATNYEYEPGKRLYPKYSHEGLPEDFVIKKSSDLSLTYKDIKEVEIERASAYPSSLSAYTVRIHLWKESAERMRIFSTKHIDRRVAVEIDGKIFAIPKILDIVSNEFLMSVARRSLSEIESEFKKVTDKIRIKETN